LKPKGPKTQRLEEKKKIVGELREKFTNANAQVLVDLCGLTVEEVTQMRKELKKADTELKVVKNTLARIAAEGTPLQEIEDLFRGPTAVAFAYGDPVETVKIIVKFAKEFEKLDLKGGMIEGKPLTAEELERVAKLPPKELLLAQVVGTMKAPLYGFVGVLAANLRNLVGVLYAIKEAKEKQ